MSMLFWVLTLFGLEGRYQRFVGTYCLLQPWRWKQFVYPKRWYLSVRPNSVQPEDQLRECEILCSHGCENDDVFLMAVTPCRLASRNERFVQIYCVHLQNCSFVLARNTALWLAHLPLRYPSSDPRPIGYKSAHFPTSAPRLWKWRQYVSPKGAGVAQSL
jgi:hypothetical protein